ncbi:hypothetical protein FRB95_009545 [Tulasnella sp. JGI-2019a]|nr:hypothetical protein FRB95_009545 [Tulasnella sp. JGI-2019a]
MPNRNPRLLVAGRNLSHKAVACACDGQNRGVERPSQRRTSFSTLPILPSFLPRPSQTDCILTSWYHLKGVTESHARPQSDSPMLGEPPHISARFQSAPTRLSPSSVSHQPD